MGKRVPCTDKKTGTKVQKEAEALGYYNVKWVEDMRRRYEKWGVQRHKDYERNINIIHYFILRILTVENISQDSKKRVEKLEF